MVPAFAALVIVCCNLWLVILWFSGGRSKDNHSCTFGILLSKVLLAFCRLTIVSCSLFIVSLPVLYSALSGLCYRLFVVVPGLKPGLLTERPFGALLPGMPFSILFSPCITSAVFFWAISHQTKSHQPKPLNHKLKTKNYKPLTLNSKPQTANPKLSLFFPNFIAWRQSQSFACLISRWLW